jgi:hypothetical protein
VDLIFAPLGGQAVWQKGSWHHVCTPEVSRTDPMEHSREEKTSLADVVYQAGAIDGTRLEGSLSGQFVDAISVLVIAASACIYDLRVRQGVTQLG